MLDVNLNRHKKSKKYKSLIRRWMAAAWPKEQTKWSDWRTQFIQRTGYHHLICYPEQLIRVEAELQLIS